MSLKSLKAHSKFPNPKGPVVLVILDGVGIGKNSAENAVYIAKTPTIDQLKTLPLYRELKAHGKAVGMPTDDDMGNSEVGHNALGAGRIFDQGASLVRTAIQNGKLFKGTVWKSAIENSKKNKSTLHFIGLLSDGNVHSHIDHLIAMLEKASEENVERVRIHTLLDGRDVNEKSALLYLEKLESTLAKIRHKSNYDYKIASGGGRMITTMDRYNADWRIVERGWKAHVLGDARPFPNAEIAVETLYKENPTLNDQYLPSFVITDEDGPVGTIENQDSVIFFNFRGDRAIELSEAFESKTFTHFDRVRVPEVYFAGMMQYDGDRHIPTHFLVDPPQIKHPLSEYLCERGITSFAISETQKYGHVTFFWNGNNSGYIDKELETYVEIPSDRIPFEQKPDMKAREITEKTIALLKENQFQFGRINYPNGDMVGHTGVFDAVVQSMETTDTCLNTLLKTITSQNGIAVVLADHGNADVMFTEKNGIRTPHTAHTLNPVPFAIVTENYPVPIQLRTDLPKAGLANVAATLCNLLGYEAPSDYEPSLIE